MCVLANLPASVIVDAEPLVPVVMTGSDHIFRTDKMWERRDA